MIRIRIPAIFLSLRRRWYNNCWMILFLQHMWQDLDNDSVYWSMSFLLKRWTQTFTFCTRYHQRKLSSQPPPQKKKNVEIKLRRDIYSAKPFIILKQHKIYLFKESLSRMGEIETGNSIVHTLVSVIFVHKNTWFSTIQYPFRIF